jgi:serine/threonine-protein kinase
VHARGIVHRDLKPANIFLVEDPAVPGRERAKLLDFGIAKLARDDAAARATRTASAIGTPAYMSPEQCRGSDIVDQRSDIYSIGCVLFAMLTGEPPFETTAPGDLFAAHLSQTPPLASSRAPEVPPAVDQILARCLAKSADDRFASTSELALAIDLAEQALLRAAASVTPLPSTMPAAAITPAPPSSTAPPASLLIRRPPRVVVVPALAALAVAAAAVVGGLLGGGAIREERQSAGAASSASAAASISSAGAASSSMSGTATPASSAPSAASIRSGGATASSTPHAAIPAPNDVPTVAPNPPSAPGEPGRKRKAPRPGQSTTGRKPLRVDRSD